MKLNISREDFLRGKLVDPEWYSAEITGVDEDASKKGDSTNWKVNFRILEDGPFKDVPVIKTFNEKAPGIAIPFFCAVMGTTELEPDREYDFHATKGAKLRIYINNKQFENRLLNEVTDYKPLNQ